jgi:hypothetical protein
MDGPSARMLQNEARLRIWRRLNDPPKVGRAYLAHGQRDEGQEWTGPA